MGVIERGEASIRGRGLRLVFPEGEDPRVVLAARRLQDGGLATPILLGSGDGVANAGREAAVSTHDFETFDPKTSARLERYAGAYAAARDLEERIALRLVRRPTFFGGMMLATGDADAMVAGAVAATASVIQAVSLTIGLAPGIRTPSSFFLMILDRSEGVRQQLLLYADCALNVDPTAEELADIAIASASSARSLLAEEPRVALLSFSTHGSASHPHVERVLVALERVRDLQPDLRIDGELQADAALVESIATRKITRPSDVAGRANVLIFPDLNSANIAYKLTQYLAGARALGPFLQGFRYPVSDLSRGTTAEDIVTTSILTLARVHVPESEAVPQ